MLIPVLDEIISAAAEENVRQILIGMGHRGRLNVLAHVLNKPYAQILAEFKDPVKASKYRGDLGWMGDVKYHSGARRSVESGKAVSMVVSLAPNPSHLEAVDPVVMGMARAGGTRVDEPGAPRFDPGRTPPILIHGDAAFPGQGVVAETLNLFRLPGYHTGDAVHIIANNQLGYTTPPGRRPQHAFFERPRARLPYSYCSRQRGRSRSGNGGRPHGLRLSIAVSEEFPY